MTNVLWSWHMVKQSHYKTPTRLPFKRFRVILSAMICPEIEGAFFALSRERDAAVDALYDSTQEVEAMNA